MKRYMLEPTHDHWDGNVIVENEDDNGEWVRADEALAEIAKHEALVESMGKPSRPHGSVHREYHALMERKDARIAELEAENVQLFDAKARIAELEAERDYLLEKARGLRDELRRLEAVKRRGSGCCDQTAHIAYEHAADIVTEVFDLDLP